MKIRNTTYKKFVEKPKTITQQISLKSLVSLNKLLLCFVRSRSGGVHLELGRRTKQPQSQNYGDREMPPPKREKRADDSAANSGRVRASPERNFAAITGNYDP